MDVTLVTQGPITPSGLNAPPNTSQGISRYRRTYIYIYIYMNNHTHTCTYTHAHAHATTHTHTQLQTSHPIYIYRERERKRESERKKERKKEEMVTTNRVQILDEAVYILHSVNTLGKHMNPTMLPPSLDK